MIVEQVRFRWCLLLMLKGGFLEQLKIGVKVLMRDVLSQDFPEVEDPEKTVYRILNPVPKSSLKNQRNFTTIDLPGQKTSVLGTPEEVE